jgi:hypothetical protein
MSKGLASYRILLCVGVLVFFATLSAGAVSYDISVRIDMENQTIHGYQDVSFIPSKSHVYFLLLANLNTEKNPYLSDRAIDSIYPSGYDPSHTQIEAVEIVQSQSTNSLSPRFLPIPPAWQTYSLDKAVLAIDLPEAKPVTLRIHFTTRVPRMVYGDQEINNGVLTWRFGWNPILIPEDEKLREEDGRLIYDDGNFPLQLPAANYSASITLSSDVVLAVGTDSSSIKEETSNEDNEVTYLVSNEAPSRTIAIAASSDYHCFAMEELEVPIAVYYLPGHDETARLLATYAKDIIEAYQKDYGAYPRARLTIVESPNKNGLSMAADGIVWLSDLFFTHRNVTIPGALNRLSAFVLAHEIAHQWWGIGIGVDLNAENWLSEGMAQYLSITYFEETYGEFGPNLFSTEGNGLLEDFVISQFGFMNLREHQVELPYIQQVELGFDEAIVKPQTDIKYDNATAVRLYDKGYLVARAIASAVGKDVFGQALSNAASQYMHFQISVAQYQEVMEKQAGRSLEALFETWLHSDMTVDYDVQILSKKKEGKEHQTTVQVKRDGGVEQPVVVQAKMASGATARKEWDGIDTTSTIIFTTSEPVRRVTIDPEHLLPDCDRLNNSDPVKLITITGSNAFPLDAYVLHPNPTAKGITITYLDRISLTIAESGLSADIYKGRSNYIFLSTTLSGSEIIGKFGYTHTVFSPIMTGSAGTYLASTETLTISGHRIISDDEPIPYIHFGFSRLPTLHRSSHTQIAVDLTLQGTGRASMIVSDEVRIIPQVYLQGAVTLGVGFGDPPQSLQHDLTELLSFGSVSQQGKWVQNHAYGTHKLYGRLAIEIPTSVNTPYNLASVVMLDNAQTRLFIAAGNSWTSIDEVGKTSSYVEAGIEVSLDLAAIGGLLPFNALLGYAMPIQGDGMGVFYFGFSL